MAEIYRNSLHYAYLNIKGDTADETPTADLVAGGTTTPLLVNGPETVGGEERWTATIDFNLTQNVGEVKVVWHVIVNAVETVKADYFDIVVPLVSVSEAREELDIPVDITDDQIIVAERKARRIIERFCGQKFEPTNETIIVKGRGDKILRTPKRVISIDEFTEFRTGLATAGYEIRGDGWELLRTLQYYYDEVLTVTGPIYDPFRSYGTYTWPYGLEYNVTGLWGWERVPSPVYDAALVLIEQRLCPESMYRDSYLETMKSSDWNLTINSAAYDATGNVVADHLLSPYRVVQAAVI